MADVFISYASEDREAARSFASALEAEGWSLWWDREIPFGRPFDEVIRSELRDARCVVVLWTENAARSHYVVGEARDALRFQKLFSVFLAPVELPYDLRAIQGVELHGWQGEVENDGFRLLLRGIAAQRGRPVPEPDHRPGVKSQGTPESPASSASSGPAATRRRGARLGWIAALLFVPALVLTPLWYWRHAEQRGQIELAHLVEQSNVAMQHGRLDEAEALLLRAVRVAPDNERIKRAFARLEDMRRSERSRRGAEPGGEPRPEAMEQELVRLLTQITVALEEGLLDEAGSFLVQAESLAPEDERIQRARNRLVMQRERLGGASREPRVPSEPLPRAAGGPDMVVVYAGNFEMGDHQDDGDIHERPVHRVRIVEAFALSRTEVTFEEYDAFVSETGAEPPGDGGWGRGRRPVINVSWEDAQAYAAWLSEKTGNRYRLPTEAEWEYAARAGTQTRWSFGDSERELAERAWYDANSGGRTRDIGTREPNPWGLRDVHGNVWEWVQDCWHEDFRGAPEHGRAWEEQDCQVRVFRGGSWADVPWALRSAMRNRKSQDSRTDFIGFRIARDLD